ncbi:MAG TPA: HAMP domain-containing sensor histidine kinase [Polyangiaceae bacterium]|nr:HAMP domain-containing sensor histidine kinase [Polyangiaceae bacterium]
METRRNRWLSYGLLPAVLVAAFVLAYFTFRTTFQLDKLRQQSVLESTLALANERADRLDKRIITEDNTVFAIADPAQLSALTERWVPTAQRETPTVRAILILDDAHDVLAFASRAGGAWGEEEDFRRLLVRRLLGDMELWSQPENELRHLHREYDGQSYLVSYWQKNVEGRRYIIVAWHDIGRIVKDTLPTLFTEQSQSKLNVVDEQGRIIYGPPLRSGEFTVGVRIPTTLYNWRMQVSPASGEEIARSVQNQKTIELVLVTLSCVVIVAGAFTILFAAQKERRLNALKTDFVANVSHELKTPLALVRMFGEMLQSGRVASDEKRKEYLDIIVNESERLSSLIENVLDFARVEKGRGSYEFAEGDVGVVVSRAAQVLKYRAEREHTRLDLQVQNQLPECRIDDRALQLAVVNLIDNAIKYGRPTPENGTDSGSAIVKISAEEQDGNVVIRVKDHGPGIPKTERERIFERFIRGTKTADRDGVPVRGSGIGLALVKHIAESHGGTAHVESEVGKGSTFILTIPIAGTGEALAQKAMAIDEKSAHDIV